MLPFNREKKIGRHGDFADGKDAALLQTSHRNESGILLDCAYSQRQRLGNPHARVSEDKRQRAQFAARTSLRRRDKSLPLGAVQIFAVAG